MKECAYCGELKVCTQWKETNEYVCFDCRLSFLEDEFKIMQKIVESKN